MKTWHWIVIAVVILGGGVAAYFFLKPAKAPAIAMNTPPKTNASTASPLQQAEQDALGFAFDEGKKQLSNLFSS